LFLYHGQDLLKFEFFLNLIAALQAIALKKTGAAKIIFTTFWGQVVLLGQA
jgi:hypothetical protein